MKGLFTKIAGGLLRPVDDDAIEFVQKTKHGQEISCELKRPRNAGFHRKYFALINYVFDVWEPVEGAPEKNKDRFREEVTILAGYYIEVPCIKGGVRYIAKSISFANMDQDEFDGLYDATANTLIKFVLKNYTRRDLDNVLANVAEFVT